MTDMQEVEPLVDWIRLVDGLKSVNRESAIIGGARYENSAEHSWHVSLMALVLADVFDQALDLGRVVSMLILHDLVELKVEGGDIFPYAEDPSQQSDAEHQAQLSSKERQAASALFGLLPSSVGNRLLQLWTEFEDGVTETATPEGAMAKAIDMVQPIIMNAANSGDVWHRHPEMSADRVRKRVAHVGASSPLFHKYVEGLLQHAEDQGFFPRKA